MKKIKPLLPYLIMAILAFIALTTIYWPLHEDEGPSICRITFSNYKFFYWPGEYYGYGTTFIEQEPLFYGLLRIFANLFHPEKIAMRTFAWFFYLLSVFCFFQLSLKVFKDQFNSIVAVCLFGMCPFLIMHSSYIREYSLFLLFSIINLYYFYDLANGKNSFVKYLFASMIFLFVHYFSIIPIVLEILFLRKEFVKYFKRYKKMTMLTLGLPIFNLVVHFPMLFYHRYKELPHIAQKDSVKMLWSGVIYPLFGGDIFASPLKEQAIFILFLGMFFIVSFCVLKKREKTFDAYIVFAFIVSVLLLTFFKVVLNMEEIELRYIIFVFPSLYLLIGLFLFNLKTNKPFIYYSMALMLLTLSVFSVPRNLSNFPEEFNIQKVLTFIRSHSKDNTIYSDDYDEANCRVKAYYDAQFFPDRLEIKNPLKNKVAHPSYVLILMKDKIDLIKNKKIVDSLVTDNFQENVDDDVFQVFNIKN